MKSEYFSETDYRNGTCLITEIGAPFESRWTIIDAVEGFCRDDQIGMPKSAPQTPAPAPGDDAELSPSVLKLVTTAIHASPEWFYKNAATLVNKAIEGEVRVAEAAKAAKAEEKDPSEMNADELEYRFKKLFVDSGQVFHIRRKDAFFHAVKRRLLGLIMKHTDHNQSANADAALVAMDIEEMVNEQEKIPADLNDADTHQLLSLIYDGQRQFEYDLDKRMAEIREEYRNR